MLVGQQMVIFTLIKYKCNRQIHFIELWFSYTLAAGFGEDNYSRVQNIAGERKAITPNDYILFSTNAVQNCHGILFWVQKLHLGEHGFLCFVLLNLPYFYFFNLFF